VGGVSERPPIERTTRYATTVLGLDEAFAFVMGNLERVDDLLEVTIKPVWSSEDDFESKRFTVVVAGMAELPAYEPERVP
jgi:hypothetical protein